MLTARGLDVFYGDVQVLWDVSFSLEQGEVTALLGPNGAGKSTTLNTISGLIRPRRGHMVFDGEPLEKLQPHEIVELGIAHVPEGRRVWPRMTVEENLHLGAYPKRARGTETATLDWVYSLFPILAERRHQLAGTLSGGQQQMVAIGRGLMTKPRLLILDEPSLGLAPKIVEQVFQVIQEIARQKVSILLVEQNAHLALQMSHRAYVLETGRVIVAGPGQDLLTDPSVRQAYLGL